jgi:hypothetical protein
VDSPLIPSGMLGDLVQISQEQCDAPELSVTLLGHIHIHKQVTDKAYYCGSIERLNFGEITHEPAIWIHTIGDDGKTESETITIAEMSTGSVPRPVRDIIVDASEKTLEEIAKAVEEELRKPMSGALVRLTVNQAPRALRGSGLLDHWRRQAYEDGQCLFIEVRVRSQEMAELMGAESDATETSAEEALRIEPEWRSFLEEKGRLDLLEAGLGVIREARGE